MEFFHEYLPFAEMSPADDYVTREGAWALAKPGEVYAIYLPPARDGVRPSAPARLWLPAAEYKVQWYDPRNGGRLQIGSSQSVSGPGFRSLGSPPGDPAVDWVALVALNGHPPRQLSPPPDG
jgi:hypothetical protein